MWMVSPYLMCRQHLLGEHRELHALVGIIVKGSSLSGYINKGLVDTGLIATRHAELVQEMTHRGYNHHSPLRGNLGLPPPGLGQGYVNESANVQELHRRCGGCRERINLAQTLHW